MAAHNIRSIFMSMAMNSDEQSYGSLACQQHNANNQCQGTTRKEANSLIKEVNKVIILFILVLVSLFAFPLPYILTEED
jgi:hypothetical protein